MTRPGGTIALASWTPDGFIGEMFQTIATHVPPPAGLASPMLWGTEDHLAELFGPDVELGPPRGARSRSASPRREAFVEYFAALLRADR